MAERASNLPSTSVQREPMQRLRQWLGLGWERALVKSNGRIYPSQIFLAELEREMARAERSHTTLTLVLVSLVDQKLPSREYRDMLVQLSSILAAVKRKVDVLGWYAHADGVRLGLILPHTHPSAPERIVGEVRERFRQLCAMRKGRQFQIPELMFEIYGYPVDGRAESVETEQLELFDDEMLIGEDERIPETLRKPVLGDGHAPLQRGAGYPALYSVHANTRPAVPAWKRTLDIVLTSAGLMAIAPLMVAIALGIRFTSPGPVFYRQRRVGRGGRTFEMWKFRSMRSDGSVNAKAHEAYLKRMLTRSANVSVTEQEMPMQKLGALDSRITPIGRILRATSLDELPQLFNVLRGEMSLVGPRPSMQYEAETYPYWCNRRFDHLPGITGLWQVSGKNRLTFKQMIRLDIYYARHCSPWLDLKILLRTFPTVLGDVREAVAAKSMRRQQHVKQEA